MVIDDESDLAELISFRLTVYGFEVATASDGASGLQRIKIDPPDLVVLDLMMPEMDGFEVIERLRQDPLTARIPVIILTAAVGSTINERICQMHPAGCMTKPFQSKDLLERIKRVLFQEAKAA